jgi:hypothetical protein
MAVFNKFNAFVGAVATKKHNLNTDTLKIMLTNAAPNGATNAIKTDITEIGAGFGYVAGGLATAFVSGNVTAGTYKLILTAASWTAAGGSIGPFRYAVLYNDTAAAKDLIGFWDYGTNLTLTDGNIFNPTLDPVNGTLTLT